MRNSPNAFVIVGTMTPREVLDGNTILRHDKEWRQMPGVVKSAITQCDVQCLFEKYIGDSFLIAFEVTDQPAQALASWLEVLETLIRNAGGSLQWHLGVDIIGWMFSQSAAPNNFASDAMMLCDLAKSRIKFAAFSSEVFRQVVPNFRQDSRFSKLWDSIIVHGS
jgi:class 3 adenylate cyclase